MNRRATLFLLAFPVGLMGVIQLLFGLLSMLVFLDHETNLFMYPAVSMLLAAMLLLASSRKFDVTKIGLRDAMLFATATWTILGCLGAIPIILITKVSFTDGVFESVSALTTTGATILSGLDQMPKTFLLYRQFLQWLGGLGVVIFVVSVLPMLNVGGMRLLKAETPGPMKDDKLSPRIASTARYLWMVYFALTFLCALSYYLAGMSPYDAIAHSLTTVSTGGFSTHDASMGYFQSSTILWVCNVFMILGAVSFALHFRVFRTRNPLGYFHDEEMRAFILGIALLSLLITVLLLNSGSFHQTGMAFEAAVFHLVSFITSTGYGAGNYTEWPYAIVFLLVFAGYLGGCAGSTAGGNKIIRNILSVKLILLEQKRLMHPRGVFTVKYQGIPVSFEVLSATAGFMLVTAFTSMGLTLVLMGTGLDFMSALTAVAACLNVLGPAFSELGTNFQPVNDFGTWVLSGAMILGRLEYFTVIALIFPSFWRF